MANYFAMGPRVLNARGQSLYDRLNAILGAFFVFIMILYAAFRGNRVVTQLPATFRTTKPPGQLPFEIINELFPSKVPPSTFEFPAVTLCAEDPAATIALTSCYRVTTADKVPCDAAGLIIRNRTNMVTVSQSDGTLTSGEAVSAVNGATSGAIMASTTLSCITVNEGTGVIQMAETAEDELEIDVTITGTRAGKAAGALVQLHDQVASKGIAPVLNFDGFFAASGYGVTEVVVRKIYDIDINDDYVIEFESRSSFVSYNLATPRNASDPVPISVHLQYPSLECVYEKEFLPLDMLFYSFFKTLVGQPVTVELKNDLAITGTLVSVDQFLNIKLDDIRVTDEKRFPHMMSVKNCFIRGSVVRYVSLPSAAVDTALLQDATRREAKA
ncbi:U6 snRNA-associated Sm-like protein LSm2 [Blyttiomyces sp. JEL0837]|nr:U6 snRNA-associated Sm-like protein LSm2 [Blyttiomyces sp. JEL0837]